MRAYFIGNMYLSSIQQGIQAGHCLAEMFVKYKDGFVNDETRGCYEQLNAWARDHKTMVLLNGGMSDDLRDFFDFLHQAGQTDENIYPYDCFSESQYALNTALTCVGIILPEAIYSGARVVNKVSRLPRFTRDRELFDNQDTLILTDDNGKSIHIQYSDWEIELMQRLNKFKLAI